MKRNSFSIIAGCCLLACIFVGCGDKNDNGYAGTPYDPAKAVEMTGFYPDSGGFATRVIISGANFGNNAEDIRVWYNDKQATVVGVNGEKIYVVTPRQPGDTCLISVAIGSDSISFPRPFIYRTMTTVTTIAGQQSVNLFAPGTLATATFGAPHYLCIDPEGNLIGSDWYLRSGYYAVFLLNEEKDIMMMLPLARTVAGGMPTIDATGRIVLFPADSGDGYYFLNADQQWAAKSQMILHPDADDIANGMKNFLITYKASLATCQLDGMVYTYGWSTGDLVKFDPVTRKGQSIQNFETSTQASLVFDPNNPELLYIAYVNKRAIFTYNVLTEEYKRIAGTLGVSGFRDGDAEDTLFGDIGQMLFDVNGDLIIADAGNHCIRKFDRATNKVSTIIGRPGVANYQDGNAEDALFNYPTGLAIDKDYNIYIADCNNHCIRKLSIQ
ncbi:MAG: IPT/TIG domain-containing protein [Odoribacteraceae bacterium]|jgi:hypothetical protein|nr:IPT/TIG domain-containing protein [Odoribacteraceae bacterium]